MSKMKEDYTKVHRLMLELNIINKIPDSIQKAEKFRGWTIKIINVSHELSPPESHMKLVQ